MNVPYPLRLFPPAFAEGLRLIGRKPLFLSSSSFAAAPRNDATRLPKNDPTLEPIPPSVARMSFSC